MDRVAIRGKGTLELSGGVLHLTWQPGITVECDDASAVLSAIATLGQGNSLPMLIDIEGVTHSAAARKVLPAPSSVTRIALLGSSPVDEVVARFRFGFMPLPFPVMYFTSSSSAMAWLLEA